MGHYLQTVALVCGWVFALQPPGFCPQQVRSWFYILTPTTPALTPASTLAQVGFLSGAAGSAMVERKKKQHQVFFWKVNVLRPRWKHRVSLVSKGSHAPMRTLTDPMPDVCLLSQGHSRHS